jgi:SAM-dependent methyltransferase
MSAATTTAEFFEAMYRREGDPWNFAGSAYETRRYDAIMAALAGERFGRAFEPGCSVGVLTERLAGVANWVTACDLSETAVQRARERCAGLKNLSIVCGGLEDVAVRGEWDLVVLSEIGYYFSALEWASISGGIVARMPHSGTLLAVHWLGTSADHLTSGDEVHRTLREDRRLALEHEERCVGSSAEERFRLDRFRRR